MATPKTGANTQAMLASPDGTRAGAGFSSKAAGDGVEPLCDLQGRAYVVPLPGFPPGTTARWQYPIAAPSFAFSPVIIGAGVLEQASGYVTGVLGPAVLTFVQVYDDIAPVGTPIMEIPILGAGTWAWSPGQGWGLAVGLAFAFSATQGVWVPIVAGGTVNATGWQ